MKRLSGIVNWLYNLNNEVIGVSLSDGGNSFDDAERLKRYLKIPLPNISDISMEHFINLTDDDREKLIQGVEALKIKDVPEIKYLEYVKQNKKTKKSISAAYLIVSANRYIRSQTLPYKNDAEFYGDVTDLEYSDETMIASGDEEGFMLHVVGKHNIKNLQQLYKHFMDKDILFTKDLEFSETMLTPPHGFVYLSKVDNEMIKQVELKHQQTFDLFNLVLNTNIIQDLKKANKKWYALSPTLDKGELKFFLNPEDQKNNNYGWFTINDLRDWIENKGSILKSSTLNTPGMEL